MEKKKIIGIIATVVAVALLIGGIVFFGGKDDKTEDITTTTEAPQQTTTEKQTTTEAPTTTEEETETTTKKENATKPSNSGSSNTTTTKKPTQATTQKPTTTKAPETTKKPVANEDISKLGSIEYGDMARAGKYYDMDGNLTTYDKIKEGEWYYHYDKNGNQELLDKPYSPGNEPTTYNWRVCEVCGKSTVDVNGEDACAHGGCCRWIDDVTCPHCGKFIPALTCHTCK